MRISRLFNSKNKLKKHLPLIFLCAFYLIGSGATGATISKFVILPYILNVEAVQNNKRPADEKPKKTGTNDEQEQDLKIMVIPQLTIYKVQAGAYKDKNNAESMSRLLIEAGYGGVIQQGDFYRVYACGFLENQYAEYFSKGLKDKGIEVRINKWTSPDMEIQYTENYIGLFQTVEKSLKALVGSFQKESKAIYDLQMDTITRKDFIDSITLLEGELADIKTLLEQEEYPEEMSLMCKGIISINSNYLKHINTIKQTEKMEQVAFIKNMHRGFLELIVEYEELNHRINVLNS